MKKGINKEKKSKIIISILLVIVLVLQIAFFSYLLKGLAPSKDERRPLMTYSSFGEIDYKVYLKNNEFVNTNDLGKDDAYILGLIDHISLTSIYRFNATEVTKVKGNTKLVAKLKVYYKEGSDKNGNPELMGKDKVLKEDSFDIESTDYSNVQTTDIYLDEYLDILNKFQQNMRIAAEGYVEVYSVTDYEGSIGGIPYNKNYEMVFKIPLSKSVFTLDKTVGKDASDSIYESELVKTNTKVKTYLIVVNVVIFLVLMLLLKKLFSYTKKDIYKRELDKILKAYDDIIVNTATSINIEDYKLIEIDEFKELLNLSRELLLPIMNYEVKKGEVTWFYVLKEDILYRYIVSKEKLELTTKKASK